MQNQRALRTGRLCGTIGLVALGAAVPAGAANLLVNPSFEAPSTGVPTPDNNICTGWTFVNDGARATFHANTGAWSAWAKTFQDTGGGVKQTVSGITAGANYLMSSQLFFEDNFNQTGSTAQLKMTWLNASNTPVGTPAMLEVPASSNPATGAWTPFSFNATAPAGASKIEVFLGWVNGAIGIPACSAFFDDVVVDGPGSPPLNSTWALDGSGDWNVGGNWANGSVPNAVGAAAEFFGSITSAQTVFTNTPVVVGSMAFNNANTYVIAGAGSLTLDATGTANATIDVQTGSHKINLPVVLNDNTTANVASGLLTIADPLNLNGKTLTKSGAGSLSIISTVTGGSAPGIINVAGGTANIDFRIGTPATASTAATANVTVNVSTAAAKAKFGADQILRRMHTFTANAGDQEIDLAGHIVRVYGADNAAEELSIYNDIKSARLSAGGHDGIYDSTSPGSNYSVGVTDQATDAHGDLHVLTRLTRNGDATVDGIVNLSDFNRLASNFGQSGKLWDQGDFNYDGIVNLTDFNLLASNFGLAASSLDGPTPQDWSNLAAAVPEPSALGMLGVASLATLRRRRSA
jgi:hypothetical protein